MSISLVPSEGSVARKPLGGARARIFVEVSDRDSTFTGIVLFDRASELKPFNADWEETCEDTEINENKFKNIDYFFLILRTFFKRDWTSEASSLPNLTNDCSIDASWWADLGKTEKNHKKFSAEIYSSRCVDWDIVI